jgi:hypothetical protein
MDDLGLVYMYEAKLVQAAPLFERALGIREKAFRPESPLRKPIAVALRSAQEA